LRLPLLVLALITVIVATCLWAAYREVEATLLRAGGERATAAADQVAGLFEGASQQGMATLRQMATDATVRGYLRNPTDDARESARARLASLAITGLRRIELWTEAGSRVLEIPPSATGPNATPAGLPPATRPSGPGVGALQVANDVVFADTVLEILSDPPTEHDASPSTRLGFLLSRATFSINPPGVLGRLIGNDAVIEIGNQTGGTWTDLSHIVSAPPVDVTRRGVARYRAANGERRLGAVSIIRNTPWAVCVEFPESIIVAPAEVFLRRMIAVTLIFLTIGAILVGSLSARITRPLHELAQAVDRIAAGDYSQRIATSRRDELGRLGQAFNTMAGRVESAHNQLADDARELATSRETVRRQNAILESVLQRMRDGVAIADRDGRFVLFNKAGELIFGVGGVDAAPDRWPGSFRPDGVTPFPSDELPLMRALQGESTDNVEIMVRNATIPSGVLINCYGRPLLDETGTAIGGVAIVEDITERRRVDRALRESEARKGAVMDGALDCVVTMDHHGTITEFNPAAERTFGYSRNEAIGQPLADLLIPESHREQHRLGLARYMATGEGPVLGKRIEMPALRRDGSQFAAELSIVAVRRDGTPFFTGFVRDLTEQKAADATRTRSFQLEQEHRQAQEANRLKSEFLANMSHELRTPLNAIIGFAELMQKGKVGRVSPTHEEYLGDIVTSSRHLLQLINDVLDLAKVESGKMDFRPEPVDLARLTAEVRSVLRAFAAGKRLHVEISVDPEVSSVVIDPARVKQILYNYLSNAIKFTPEGGMVTVRVAPESASSFRIDVEDTGVGIAPENVGRLFVEFQQLDASAAKTYQGTGLGLALTKRLAEAQGGRVLVRSTVGAGSTFSVVLPRIMTPTLAGTSAAVPARARFDPTGTPTVLIVDDDPKALKMVDATLRQSGFHSVCVATAEEALRIASMDLPAVAVVDILMPGMDGFEFIDRFRRVPGGVRVPIVVWTVKDLDASERERLRSSATAVVLKRDGGAMTLLKALQRLLPIDA
jgi:PAS domain S-box-containing protein